MNKVLYNVTVSVDESVHLEWLDWMKKKHIPDVMATGFFLENRICRIHAFEEGGVSYAIQYLCRNMQDYNEYQEKMAPRLQGETAALFGTKLVAFRTVLEIIHEHRGAQSELFPN